MANSTAPEVLEERIRIKSFVAENYETMTIPEMARELKVSYRKIQYAAGTLGVQSLIGKRKPAKIIVRTKTKKEKAGFFDVDAEENWLK